MTEFVELVEPHFVVAVVAAAAADVAVVVVAAAAVVEAVLEVVVPGVVGLVKRQTSVVLVPQFVTAALLVLSLFPT